MIWVEDLSVKYPAAKGCAIRGVSFSVQPGEVLGFLGPSGAGKSTLQRVLTGTMLNYKGNANVLGLEVRDRDNRFYERIGVVFEFPNFYGKLTAIENLRYFGSLYSRARNDPMALLDRVGLAADAGKRVSEYSKGMKMRLAFVRSILHKPELLFLDEPTSGLDPSNARVIKEIILEMKGAGNTVVLTTHNMHDAEELCDRVAFMVDGQIRALDTPRAFHVYKPGTKVEYSYIEAGHEKQASSPLSALNADQVFQDHLRGGSLTSIHSKESSLEDVFIQLTGRCLQ